MTTADLIKLLQKIDPDGTTPVCVDNLDVHYVTRIEAYWDGRLEQLIRDDKERIVGARITAYGYKVRIYTRSIEDMLFDDPEAPVDLAELGGSKIGHLEQVARWRAEGKALRDR